MFASRYTYLGQEGYCLELELREGSQHCQIRGARRRRVYRP